MQGGIVQANLCRSRWPRGLWRRSEVARLLGFRVRIPSGTWMCVSCQCRSLSGWGLCDRPNPHSEESCRMWCACMWSRNLNNEAVMPPGGEGVISATNSPVLYCEVKVCVGWGWFCYMSCQREKWSSIEHSLKLETGNWGDKTSTMPCRGKWHSFTYFEIVLRRRSGKGNFWTASS